MYKLYKNLIAIVILSLLCQPVKSEEITPNSPNNKPAPGWTLWKNDEQNTFEYGGYSNSEALDYSAWAIACNDPKIDQNKVKLWYRMSNNLMRIGAGKVELGCWYNGGFIGVHRSEALKTGLKDTECWEVTNPKGLIIYESMDYKSKKIGKIRYKTRFKVSISPFAVDEKDGEYWIYIEKPKEGFVSDGKIDGKGNLKLCNNK